MSTYRMPAVLPQPDQGVSADSTLPGLRGLAKLADLRPTIVVQDIAIRSKRRADLRFRCLRRLHSLIQIRHCLRIVPL
jgi:hypothetical protein